MSVCEFKKEEGAKETAQLVKHSPLRLKSLGLPPEPKWRCQLRQNWDTRQADLGSTGLQGELSGRELSQWRNIPGMTYVVVL